MRTTDEIFENFTALRDECIDNIGKLIKSTGENTLEFETSISIAYAGWDGWENQSIISLTISKGELVSARNENYDDLDIDAINLGEWWYILEMVEDQIKPQ